jgi:hypothetical protein
VFNTAAPIFASVKKGIALILLLVFTLQTFYASAFTVWFYANRKAIAKEHCINKNRPELKCDGKCFLKMKMQQNEQHQDEEAPLHVKQMLEGNPFTPAASLHLPAAPVFTATHIFVYHSFYHYQYSGSIFHPPLQA